MEKTLHHGPDKIQKAIETLATSLADLVEKCSHLGVLGIANGGVPFARRLVQELEKSSGQPLPTGVLDVVFSRDDIAKAPIPKQSIPTSIPFDVEGSTVILADDVIFSGRTVRAALEELFQHGRPSRVVLVVLVDRGGRSLPIQPDFVGFTEDFPGLTTVKVRLSSTASEEDNISLHTTISS